MALRVEEQPANRGVCMRVARIDQQCRHQLAERIVDAALRRVGHGEFLVQVRIIGVQCTASVSDCTAAAVSPSTCASRAIATCSMVRPSNAPESAC